MHRRANRAVKSRYTRSEQTLEQYSACCYFKHRQGGKVALSEYGVGALNHHKASWSCDILAGFHDVRPFMLL